MKKIAIFDSTLRDGAQGEGISFTVTDKIKIVRILDNIGVSYIEAGNPGSNPKDLEFFTKMQDIELKNSKLVAFGSTRRRNTKVYDDSNVHSLHLAKTPVVTIFGKSWDFHVTDIINTSLKENLLMIKDTISFFKDNEKEVIYDAEHFFDGYKANPDYAIKTLKAAFEGGADTIVLCDTNGGSFPNEVFEITSNVVKELPKAQIGIHTHNDGEMAVANTLMAVEAGVTHVQGTFIGFGERCGNANLSAIIANLQLKRNFECISPENIVKITSTARKIAEISNVIIRRNTPYIGSSAFSHKGGMHIDGVSKASRSFEHVNPEHVGNKRRFLMSEVSGKSTILSKIQEIDPKITKDSIETQQIIDKLKALEHKGYQFEAAESSFELIIRKHLGKYKPFFEVNHFNVLGDHSTSDKQTYKSTAIVKVKVFNQEVITAAEGDGPVNALDKALRKGLDNFYPELKNLHLTDYKVRVIDSKDATGAKVRVLIESTDGVESWTTIGVSKDIIEASWFALLDSIEYKLIKALE